QVQCNIMGAACCLSTTCALTYRGFLGVISARHEHRNLVRLKCFSKLQPVIKGYVRFTKTGCFGSGVEACPGVVHSMSWINCYLHTSCKTRFISVLLKKPWLVFRITSGKRFPFWVFFPKLNSFTEWEWYLIYNSSV